MLPERSVNMQSSENGCACCKGVELLQFFQSWQFRVFGLSMSWAYVTQWVLVLPQCSEVGSHFICFLPFSTFLWMSSHSELSCTWLHVLLPLWSRLAPISTGVKNYALSLLPPEDALSILTVFDSIYIMRVCIYTHYITTTDRLDWLDTSKWFDYYTPSRKRGRKHRPLQGPGFVACCKSRM